MASPIRDHVYRGDGGVCTFEPSRPRGLLCGASRELHERAITQVGPHPWVRRPGWRFWLCRHCYAPKSLHPRLNWVRARPLGDTTYYDSTAPHFGEGW